MADNTIDTLDIQVKSSTARAVKALGDLESKLSGLNRVFGNLNTGGLRNYSRELGRATAAASALSKVKIVSPSVGGLTKEIRKLSRIDLSGLSGVKENLTNLSDGLKELSKIDLSGVKSEKIKELSTSVSKLKDLKVPNLSDFAKDFKEFASIDVKSTGVNNTINAIKRLATADIGKFNPIKIAMIGNSLKSLARVPDVSSNLNRFVSSFAKLAQAGGKTGQAASGFADLGRQVRKTITNLSGVGEISESLNLFIQSIGRLASAGGKAGQTAGGLKSLATETRGFFEVMKNAPKISENTIQMTQALAQLASAGGRVNTAANTISSSFSKLSTAGKIAKASFNVLVKTTKFAANQIMKLSSKIVSAFKSITSSSHGLRTASLNMGTLLKTALGFRAVQGLWNFGKTAIKTGSDVAEVQNIVKTAFGGMTGMVDEFASTAIEKFGLSELAAKKYAGTMMAMLNSTGVAKDAASEMSITLAGLAGDLASFYNISADEAFTAIRAGISGETEPLKRFGINMNIANINAYALANGLHKTYNEMTLSEQAIIRYNYLMAATSQQQGDFARTSGSWANQVRILAMNFQQLASILGQGLIAAILPAVQALNALMGKLIQVAKVFRDFVYALMGKSIEGSQGGIVNDLAGIGDTSSGLENLGSAGGDAASGMDDATDSAQKLKKTLSVLSFDELNQLSESASSAGGALSGIGGGGFDNIQTPGFGGLANALDELGKTDPTKPINEWAERIRKAFLDKEWDKLGLIIAQGLNKGLWHVYNAISWKNVGPKITAFTNAFTEAFNNLVTGLDWNRLGRVVGTGINTLVNTFNSLVGPFGIDFNNIGRKLSVGLRGAIDEIEWTNLGSALGNGFMISWKMLDGFITDMSKRDGAGINGWNRLGESVGEALKAALHRIDFNTIANVFSTGFNSIFDFLKGFNASKPFEGLGEKISTALNNAISNINAVEAGQTLNTFVQSILDTLLTAAEKTNWEEFGNKVGTFLSQIEWGEILRKAFSTVKEVLGGIWSGLGDTSAGKFIQGVVIFKLGTKLMPFVNNMVSFFTGSSVTQKLSGAFQTLFNGGLSGATNEIKGLGDVAKTAASGGFKSLLSAIGSSGAGIGLIAVLPVAASLMGGFVEKLMGGNGKLTDMGASINDLAGKLQQLGTLSKEQADEVWSLVDAWESEGLSAQEMATKLMEKFSEWGLSTDAVNAVLQDNNYWTSQVKDNVDLLSESAGQLGEGMSKTAGEIDLSSVSMKEAMGGIRDVLYELSRSSDEFGGSYQGILLSMDDTLSSATTAQGALDMLTGQLEAAGIPADEFIAKLQEKFPQATQAVKTSVDTNITSAQQTVTTEMGKAGQAVSNTTSSIKKEAEKNLSGVKSAAEQSASGANEATVSNWGNSAREVTLKVREMKLAASTELSNMTETVRSYSQSMYNIMTKKWEQLSGQIVRIIKQMKTEVSKAFSSMTNALKENATNSVNSIASRFSSLPRKISSSLGENMYNAGRNAASSFANGISSVHIPMPHINVSASTWSTESGYSYSMSSSVNWYKSGGLFNMPSVIGVGEAGKEAVLPLENRRTMSMIADSILSNSKSMGMDEKVLTDAVARGVAMAMMNNQQNPINVTCYAELRTEDNEVLARAVTKGQQSLDYRMHPTPQF